MRPGRERPAQPSRAVRRDAEVGRSSRHTAAVGAEADRETLAAARAKTTEATRRLDNAVAASTQAQVAQAQLTRRLAQLEAERARRFVVSRGGSGAARGYPGGGRPARGRACQGRRGRARGPRRGRADSSCPQGTGRPCSIRRRLEGGAGNACRGAGGAQDTARHSSRRGGAAARRPRRGPFGRCRPDASRSRPPSLPSARIAGELVRLEVELTAVRERLRAERSEQEVAVTAAVDRLRRARDERGVAERELTGARRASSAGRA